MFEKLQPSAPRPDVSSHGVGTPRRMMTGRFQIIFVVYTIAVLAYVGYSDITESGLDQYLMKFQMDIIGEAGRTTTGILSLCVLMAPFFAIAGIVEKFAPSLIWIRSEAGRPRPGTLDERLNRVFLPPRISWKVVFVVTTIPIVVAAGIFAVLKLFRPTGSTREGLRDRFHIGSGGSSEKSEVRRTDRRDGTVLRRDPKEQLPRVRHL